VPDRVVGGKGPTPYDARADMHRRHFLGALGPWLAAPSLNPRRLAAALEPFVGQESLSPEVAAADESLWFGVQQAYTVDRSVLNLNNGGVSPAPADVQDAMKRYLDFSHQLPSHNLWRVLAPQRETTRQELARTLGSAPDEVAILRNTSEALQTLQLGFDLEPGDEVLTTNQDYPRMITTFRQRERRDGIRLVQIEGLPTPCEDPARIVERFEEHVTERTRLILVSHVINLTGQILPIRELCALGRRRGIPVLVDGAHSFAQFDFDVRELGVQYYATSLHKWLCAPHGTGLLYVAKDRIRELWPLMAAPEAMEDDIRKFEELGTHPLANFLAVSEALAFHHGIGIARKAARLRYLRDYWALRLLAHSDRVHMNTSLLPSFSCAIGNVRIDGLDTAALQSWLWRNHRILTVAIRHAEFEGLRVSANVYTRLEELDRFCDTIELAMRDGLPG